MPERSPRFGSPIHELDRATHGGLYGVTGLGGDAGAGKSFLALGTALLAALRGDCAIYLAAEMTRDQIANRLYWLAGRWDHPAEDVDRLLNEFKLAILQVPPRTEYAALMSDIGAGLYGEDRALLVVDSLNALLTSLVGEESYWDRYERLLATIVEVRKQSEGLFGALVLSELNQDGVSKGRRLEYQADLMLHMRQSKAKRTAKITIAKNRESGDSGPLGYFRLTSEGVYERVEMREE